MSKPERIAFFASLAVAVALTLLYWTHEDFPRYRRAPTSLLPAPIAVIDGLCYYAGIPGIYGRSVRLFLVNWCASLAGCRL